MTATKLTSPGTSFLGTLKRVISAAGQGLIYALVSNKAKAFLFIIEYLPSLRFRHVVPMTERNIDCGQCLSRFGLVCSD